MIAVGCPIWLVARLAEETGATLRSASGGECEVVPDQLRVFGANRLSGPAGTFIVQDLISGWSYGISLRCHRDLPPSTWTNFTTALSDGLDVMAAVDLVGFVDVT